MPIDPSQPVPQWRAVYEDLRRRVASGEWRVGEQLPAISELQVHYNARSLNTIRSAQQLLVEDGMLKTERGLGAFVVSHTPPVRPRRSDATSLIPLIIRIEMYDPGVTDWVAAVLTRDDAQCASAPSVGEHIGPGTLGTDVHELIGMHPTVAKVEHYLTFGDGERPPATAIVIRHHLERAAETVASLRGTLRAAGWICQVLSPPSPER